MPLSYRFNADEMQYVIDNSDATLVVVDAEQAPLVAEIRDRIPKVRAVIAFGGETPAGFEAWDDLLASQPDHDPTMEEATADSVGAQMLYTSGTTGKPKGAVRTTSDPVIVAALLGELGLIPGGEVHITTGPLYHSGPLAFAVISHTLGCPVVILRKFDPVSWLRLVKEHNVTNTFSAPTQLKRLVTLPPGELERADLSSMRCLIANAAPVPYALKQEVVAKLGDGFLYEVYGSTELGIVTVLKPADQLRKPGSCGKVYGGIEVKLVREDGTDADVGEPGELFIRTGLAMDGYHRTDEQLAELSDGGWKSVGDVAYRDDEGFLFINDRKKDMIISGGVNIYPAEIEAVLHEHPQVLDVAVFGIPDDEWGESVYAVVQPKPGETIDLDGAARVRRGARRRLQASAPVRAPRRAAENRRRQAPEAGPARRVLARPRHRGVTPTVTRTLSEHESKRVLAAAGVPVLDERVVETPGAAVDAAREVAPGAAVVAKLCGDGVTHKTERGLVRLGLHGDDDVRAASAALLDAATPEDGAVGVLVAPMVRGSRELIAGVYRDEQFGPSVMLGVGGVLAEALADVAFRLVPVERVDAEEMLDDLAAQPLLGPVRGEPPVDRGAVADVVLELSQLTEDRPDIVSVDINPLVVVDGRPVAVDALVEVRV